MTINWEKIHEALLADMCDLLGLPRGSNNQQMNEALQKADEPVKKVYATLNACNDYAVKKALKQL